MTTNLESRNRFSFRYYLQVLLIVLFPLQLWGLMLVFRDVEFVSNRTELWDAVGYASYTIFYILVESLVITFILCMVSLAFPKRWGEKRAVAVVGVVYMALAWAGILDFAAHLFSDIRISRQYLYGLENFTNLTYTLIAAAVLVVSAVCLAVIFRSSKGEKFFTNVFERIVVLGYFYLFLDFAGIVIILIRNFSNQL